MKNGKLKFHDKRYWEKLSPKPSLLRNHAPQHPMSIVSCTIPATIMVLCADKMLAISQIKQEKIKAT